MSSDSETEYWNRRHSAGEGTVNELWSGHRIQTGHESRAVTPVAGKLLEIGIVVLFLATMSTALYGGVVPDYRTAVGETVGDRTLTAADHAVRAAIPPRAGRPTVQTARIERTVDLPDTIRGEQYQLSVTDGTLILTHPQPTIGGKRPIALPEGPTTVSGVWRSGTKTVIVVHQNDAGTTVELVNR